jgi:hypothetical protein
MYIRVQSTRSLALLDVALEPVSTLQNLQELHFKQLGDHIEISPLFPLTSLKRLHLESSSWTAQSLDPISELSSLTQLYMRCAGWHTSSLGPVSKLKLSQVLLLSV